MKRLACFLLVLALAGCAPAASLPESASVSETANTLTMADKGVNATGYFTAYFNPIPSKAGILLARWSFADRTVHIACTAEGCDHTGETCEARLSGYPIWVLDDAVYCLEQSADDELYSLFVRDADGTHPVQLGTLGYWSFFGADEECLYGFCDGSYGRVSRTGGVETFLAHGLQSDFYDYGRILGVWQDRFLAVNWDIDNEQPARICLLDRDGGVTDIAQVDPARFSNYNCIAVENEVIYLDLPTGDVMAVNVDTGETRTVTQALRQYNALEADDFYKTERWYLQRVQDHILVRVVDFVNERTVQNLFLVNEDGTVSELSQRQELRDFSPESKAWFGYTEDGSTNLIRVVGEWGDQLVVLNALQASTLETDDGPVQDMQSVYSLMDAEDYLANREIYREFILPE